MSGLEIAEQHLQDNWTSINVGGEIDLATIDELSSAIKKVQDVVGSNLLVDLTGTDFMDSTGLKTLVVASREFDAAGRLFAIAIKPGPIARLIELSGVESTMRIVGDAGDLIGDVANFN
jgi:anti-sigma B factor antagonist